MHIAYEPHEEPKRRSRARFLIEGIEGSLLLAASVCSWPLSRRWLRNWGSRPSERVRAWPGDRYVPLHRETRTRAIDIDAPADAVWPWVVQFGLDRAGFYSYELLERLAGIPVTNIESIDPTMQSLVVGDEIRLHPKAPGIPIVELLPGRHICFGQDNDAGSTGSRSGPARSWSIYLETAGSDACRLLVRGCTEQPPKLSWRKRLAMAIEAPIDFVMEQRMLRTIKRLAERMSPVHTG